MAITHATVKAPGQKVFAVADWNAAHAGEHDPVTVADSQTIDLTLAGQQVSAAAIVQMSLTADASGLKLVNDADAPGNSKVYGTNGAGAKGWQDAPVSTVYATTSFRAVGYYFNGCMQTGVNTQAAHAANRIYARPFLVTTTQNFDRIAFYNNAIAGNARMGIYNDNGSVYPGTLLVDAGTVTTTAGGVKTIEINVTLTPGLYWLAYLMDAAVTLDGTESRDAWNPLGTSNVGDVSQNGYYVAYAYGVLPAAYPGGATRYGAAHTMFLRRKA